MKRPLVSVIMASFQRKHLLERSLWGYQHQNFDNDLLELIVIDDHSTDLTRELVLDWSKTTKIQAVVLTASPKPSEWIDCGKWLNYGIRVSLGEHIILTHPEIIPGRDSLKDCVNALREYERINPNKIGLYTCCKGYYLSPQDQVRIDTVDWKGKGNLAVRDIEDFYEPIEGGNPDYSHIATDSVGKPGYKIQVWDSWIFGGHSRRTWKILGGFLTSERWGSCDVSWTARRKTLGISNYTCIKDSDIVCHQNHDLPGNILTPRNMEAWVDELSEFNLTDPSELTYPKINNLGWL